MSNNSENAYIEETDYFYSLNLPGLSWQQCKFNGDLPSSKYLLSIKISNLPINNFIKNKN